MAAHHAASDRHHPVVVIIATGTMGAVRAEIPVLIAGAVLHLPVPVVLLHRVDADQAGLILPPALVKRLHHKDATTYPHQVAEADLPGTLLLVPAAHREQVRLPQPERPLHLAEEQVAVPVHPDITGCLIMADGACPMVQLEAAALRLQPQHRHQLLPNLLLLQANQLQLPVHKDSTL